MRGVNVRAYMRNGKIVKAHQRGVQKIKFDSPPLKTKDGRVISPLSWGSNETGFKAKILHDPKDPLASGSVKHFYNGNGLYQKYTGDLNADQENGLKNYIDKIKASRAMDAYIEEENRKYYFETRKKKRKK